MKRHWRSGFWRSAAQCVAGGIAVVLASYICLRLGLDIHEVTFICLILVALLAVIGNFIGSLVLVLVAVGSLNYFFTTPRFSFWIDSTEDIITVVVFLATSLLVNGLIFLRKRADDALRQSEAYLAEAQKVSHTGSFGWHVGRGEIVWSEETFRIFGCDPATKPSLELVLQRVHPEDRAILQGLLDRVSRDGKDWELEHRLVMPDGAVKRVRVVARAVGGASGDLEFVGAVMDVTAARRAEEELQRAQSELAHVARVTTLGELTAVIAHEVNQPIGAVVTNADAGLQWLGAEPPDLGEVRQVLGRIVREGNRASEIINRIRALVKKSPPRKELLDINDTVLEVVALIRGELLRNRIALRTQLAADLPPILGDRIQLQQVALNLMMNAVEAIGGSDPARRELLVATAKRGAAGVVVEVRDTGPGLDGAALDRLFDAFYTTKPQGMGMGLSISRTIVENHGGRLRAEPNQPRGATFQIELPVDGEDAGRRAAL
jgi:signal transduction histidine kinase